MSTMCFSRESIFFSGKLTHNLTVSHALFTPIKHDFSDSQAHGKVAIRGLSKEQLSRIIAFCNQGNSCVRKKMSLKLIATIFRQLSEFRAAFSLLASNSHRFDIGQCAGARRAVCLIKMTKIVP